MKRWGTLIGVLLALFAAGVASWLCSCEPEIPEETIFTREGIVTDRAMSDGLPYLTVEFADGTAICCWEILADISIPEEVRPGRGVTVTCGMEQGRERWILLDIKLEELDYKR